MEENDRAGKIPTGSIEMLHVVQVSCDTFILPSLLFLAEMRNSLQSV